MHDGIRISDQPATVCLHLDHTRIFQWHLWLAEALAASGADIAVSFSPDVQPLPRVCAILFELERLVYGLRGLGGIAQVESLPTCRRLDDRHDPEFFDVTIDFAGNGTSAPPSARRTLRPSFNGAYGELGLIAAVTSDTDPLIEVYDSARPGRPWTGRPGLADRGIVSQSLDNALSCAARLLLSAIRRPMGPILNGAGPVQSQLLSAPSMVGAKAVFHSARAVTQKMLRLLNTILKDGENWAVAWRLTGSNGLLQQRGATFTLLRDDGQRYYADPFPFAYHGRNFVFVEEFPYATGKGCISVFEIDAAGRSSTPRTVLEEPHHLSYPFAFELEGEVWMIPEAGAEGGIYLYRAEDFPERWRLEACLIGNIEAYDTTLLQDASGGFWLFACERRWNSSSWDMLTLFYADSLFGEWRAHPGNPVVMDARLSRPGGAVFRRGDQWLRPAQDCSQLYGGALGLCRIDALGPDRFSQSFVGRIASEAARGCHTYNRHGGLETLDVFGRLRGKTRIPASYSPAAPGDVSSSDLRATDKPLVSPSTVLQNDF